MTSPRHFLTLLDLSREELASLIARARVLKKLRGTAEHPRLLAGKSVAIVLEKVASRRSLAIQD